MFSICIPNYNYEKYLPATLQSVIQQGRPDIEIVVSDNASTDGSVEVVKDFQRLDSRIKLKVNNCNVGFSGNLNKAAEMASGEWMTMLSSDDLVNSSFFEVYRSIIDFLGSNSHEVVLSSAQDVIDSSGNKIGYIGVDWKLWAGAKRDSDLSEMAGADVWILDAAGLLRNSLLFLRTPFAFASTTYSRKLYQSVEGYSQGGIINPDKRFAWAILGRAKLALMVDKPLVSYRVHHQNQNSQQAESGALKHQVDQYVSTFQVENQLLSKAGLEREMLQQAFIEQDVALRGLATLADGNVQLSKRILSFGRAAYPHFFSRNKKIWALRILTSLGQIGAFIAKKARDKYYTTWQNQSSRNPRDN